MSIDHFPKRFNAFYDFGFPGTAIRADLLETCFLDLQPAIFNLPGIFTSCIKPKNRATNNNAVSIRVFLNRQKIIALQIF